MRSPRGQARWHVLLGVVAIVALPAFSRWSGVGGLAFTMFSGSGSYRLRVGAVDEAGAERRVAATAIAARAGGTVGDVLAGSETWRFAPFGPLVRRHLDQVATFACAASPASRVVHVALDERPTLDATTRTTTLTQPCP